MKTLATLIVQATEQIAARTGPAIGGLLNATFGNLPELIISVAALRAGLTEMVRASLIGALLANTLLALGLSSLLGGRKRHEQEFNPAGARTYSSMMLLTALCLAAPAAFHRFFSDQPANPGASLDVGVAILLLAVYVLYLLFMLRSHPDSSRAPARRRTPRKRTGARSGPRRRWSSRRSARRGPARCSWARPNRTRQKRPMA